MPNCADIVFGQAVIKKNAHTNTNKIFINDYVMVNMSFLYFYAFFA